MLSRFITVLVLIFMLPRCADAAGPDISRAYETWRWVHFGAESGLPSERVLRILETASGEIWVQTSRGLAWFDGFRWHTVHIPGLTESDEAMASYGEDTAGILVCHERNLYRVRQDSVRSISLTKDGARINVFNALRINQGTLIQSDSCLYLWAGDSLEHFPSPYDRRLPAGRLPRYVTNGIFGARNSVWMKMEEGLYRLRAQNWSNPLRSASGFVRLNVLAENAEGHGAGIVETTIGVLDLYFWGPDGRLHRQSQEEGDLVSSLDIAPNGDALLLLASGELWHHHRGILTKLPAFPSPVNRPLFIRFRANGDLWVATERGLFLCRLTSERWSTWNTGNSGRARIVNRIVRSRDGKFWIGTRDGLYERNPDGTGTHIRDIQGQLLGRVTAVAEDPTGNIWIGSGASFSGTFRWDGRTWRRYGDAEGLKGSHIHRIVCDRSGGLWFLGVAPGNALNEPGAYLWSDGRFTHLGKHEGLLDERVYSMVEDRSGDMWFGTATGLSRFSHGSWRYWKAEDGLKVPQVFTLAVDSTNRIWFGHRWAGVGYIDSTLAIRYYTVDDGLVSNQVWDLDVDAQGRLWAGTLEGVSCFDGSSWRAFDVHTGLANSQVWPVVTISQHLYAGTYGNGVSILDLNELNTVPHEITQGPPLVENRRVTLSWVVNAFWADVPPANIDTRYRLEGERWSAWSSARSHVFDRLDPGTYRFDVELRSSSWQSAGRLSTVSITVPPPVYLRPVVALPMVVLLLIVITLVAAMWERKRRYDQVIRDSELRFRAQYQSAPVATFTLKWAGDEFHLADANDAAHALTGGTVTSWVGRPLQEMRRLVPDSVRIVERCFAEHAVLHQELTYTFAGKRQATNLALTYAYVKPDMVLVHVEDVTERKQAELRNRESREQLRALAARLESIREEERTQLSREIHDELGQLMTGLKMDLAWIRKRIAEFGDQAAAAMMARVQQMNTLLDDSIQTVRKLSGQLRPALLDALGLIAAIEWQAKEWQARTGIVCQVDVLIDEPHMSKEHATELFRIFQELLTNIARHAGASEAGVILESADNELWLEVRDNGRGIKEDEVNRRLSLGILGMEERAARLGGYIRFTGIPGHGTTVRVTIPLQQVET